MNNNHLKKPVILAIGGHDPTGAAGIQADIESISANGGTAVSLVTCLTLQNTAEFLRVIPVDASELFQQFELLINDISVDAIKIGLVPDECTMISVERILKKLGNIPVVLDPVFKAGSGKIILTEKLYSLIYENLIPISTLITPNSLEARLLTGLDELDKAGKKLLETGCTAILITGTHEPGNQVNNILYQNNLSPESFKCERLPGEFHGSGCTLASALATQLALGKTIKQAVENSLSYTWQSLQHAISLGNAQQHPNRFFSRK